MADLMFSLALKNMNAVVLLKTGNKVSGKIVQVTPYELKIKREGEESLIVVNRDSVEAYTANDDVKRIPELPKLFVTRCLNPVVRCQGVNRITTSPDETCTCELMNMDCEFKTLEFDKLGPKYRHKLLNGIQVGEYPKESKND